MTKTAYHHGNLRLALLDEAEKELKVVGSAKLSLRKVATRAGVSHAAPAHHFKNATGLLTALTVRAFEKFDVAIETAKSDNRNENLDPLDATSLAYIEFAVDEPELFSLMFTSQLADFDDQDLDAASMKSFLGFINDVEKRTGGPSGAVVNVPVMAYWGKVHGLAVLLLNGRMRSVLRLSPDERREAILAIMRHA